LNKKKAAKVQPVGGYMKQFCTLPASLMPSEPLN